MSRFRRRLLAAWGPCPQSGASEPLSLEEELENVGLEYPEDWDIFMNCITNGSADDVANCICWMRHYLLGCSGIPNICSFTCLGVDPFNDPGEPHIGTG